MHAMPGSPWLKCTASLWLTSWNNGQNTYVRAKLRGLVHDRIDIGNLAGSRTNVLRIYMRTYIDIYIYNTYIVYNINIYIYIHIHGYPNLSIRERAPKV